MTVRRKKIANIHELILHTIGIYTHSNTLHEFLQFDGFSSFVVPFPIICSFVFCSVWFGWLCFGVVVVIERNRCRSCLFVILCFCCCMLLVVCLLICSCCCLMRQKEIGDRFLCWAARRSIEQNFVYKSVEISANCISHIVLSVLQTVQHRSSYTR